jgi:hypothetical protein
MGTRKKILLVCDVNNVLLMIGYNLYKLGFDVKYLPDLRLNQHFRIWDAPLGDEAFFKDIILFNSDFNLNRDLINNISPSALREKIERFVTEDTLVIGSDWAPAIFEYAGKKLDYFLVTGADVNYYTVLEKSFVKRYLIYFLKCLFVSKSFDRFLTYTKFKQNSLPLLQRKGIANCQILINSDYFNWSPLVNISYTMVPYPIGALGFSKVFNFGKSKNHELIAILEDIRKNCDYIVLNVSKNDFWKGSVIFFEGFCHYLKTTQINAKLLIFNRGQLDLIRDKYKYVDDLIESGSIIILPVVSQKDLNTVIHYADVCFGAISSKGYIYDWNTSIMQYLCMSKPVITLCPFNSFSGFSDIPNYPHLSARNSFEVSQSLSILENNVDRFQLSKDVEIWNNNFMELALQKWNNLLTNEPCKE